MKTIPTSVTLLLLTSSFLSVSTMPLFSQSKLDTTFAPLVVDGPGEPGLVENVMAIATRSDGQLLVGGDFESIASGFRRYFALVKLDGSTDTTFTPAPNEIGSEDGVKCGLLSISSDWSGSIYGSGYFSRIGGVGSSLLTKLNEKGVAVFSFTPDQIEDPGVDFAPYSLPLENGEIVVWGRFRLVGGLNQVGLAILLPSGLVKTTFRPMIQAPGYLNGEYSPTSVAVQSDGKIVVGGLFTAVNGVTRRGLARVNSDGTLDTGFTGFPDFSKVHCICLLPDSDLLVSGILVSSGSDTLVRLNSDGSVDSGFSVGATGVVSTIIPRVDGRILVTGDFNTIAGVTRNDIAVLETDGSASSAYSAESTNGYVVGSTVQTDGKVVIGGVFSSVSGQPRTSLARLDVDGVATQSIVVSPDGSVIEWQRSGSLPEVVATVFEYSQNNGVTWTSLGAGTRNPGGWTVGGSSVPWGKDVRIRVQGRFHSGSHNASSSIIATTQSFPLITDQPDSQIVLSGAPGVTFSVAASSAATITNYQWKKNGVNIPGASGIAQTSYTVPHAITTADAGSYTVVVTSTAGSKTSSAAVLTVVTPPTPITIGQGKTPKFSVSISPAGTASYQWSDGAGEISMAKASTYSIPNVQLTDEDNFLVKVTNSAGFVVTPAVALNVVLLPVQNTPPAHLLVGVGDPALFSPALTIESPTSFVWSKDAKLFAVTPTADLNIPFTQLTNAGKYTLKATNAAGSVTTNPAAELGVVDQINPGTVVVGENLTAVLKAPVAGNGLVLAWKKGAGPFSPAPPRITFSADGRTVTIRQAALTDEDDYSVVVTGPLGPVPSLTSAAIKLVVTTGAPEIDTGALNLPDGMVGAPYDSDGTPGAPFVAYQIPTLPDPHKTATSYSASNLPPGIKLDTVTGKLSGTPTKAGDWLVKFKAKNASGTSVEQSDTLHIEAVTPSLVGTFVGLVSRTTLGEQHGGLLDLTVTTAGTFSGKVTLGTATYSFTGGDLQAGVGYNQTNTIIAKKTGQLPLTLTFDLDAGANLLSGSVTDGTNTASISGYRNKWSASVLASDYLGTYNFKMSPPALPPGDFSHPSGYSYGSFKPSTLGKLTVAGRLADGTSYSAASLLGPTGQVIIYKGFTNVSSIAGTVTVALSGSAPEYATSSVNGSVTWLRDDQSSVASVRSYKTGFGPITMAASGFEYAATPGSNVLGVSTTTPVVSLTFTSGADVTTSPDALVTLSAANKLTFSTANSAKLALTIVGSTGIITTGSFKQTDSGVTRTTKSMGGIVVREGTNPGIGYGFFNLEKIPASATSPVVSGKFEMQ